MKIKTEWFSHLHNYRKRELDLIFSKCPDKLFQTALELGAGDGFQSTLLTNYISKLISSDINPSILGQKDSDSIDYCICDAEKVGRIFKEKQFDLIFSSNLLAHLPDLQGALNGIYEVLKDDGIVIHVMPNLFWYLCRLVLNIPNMGLVFLETITEKDGLHKVWRKIKKFRDNFELNVEEQKFGNNPKALKVARSFWYRLLMPEPSGASSSTIKELYTFSRSRWKKEFKKADLDLVKITKGPVSSGYGFGLDFIRGFLEKMGITTEYIYIAVKKGHESRYEQYF